MNDWVEQISMYVRIVPTMEMEVCMRLGEVGSHMGDSYLQLEGGWSSTVLLESRH